VLGYDVAAFGKVAHGEDVKRWDFSYFDTKFSVANACGWLAKHDPAKPVCLFVGTHDPHVPWDKSEKYDPKQVKLPANFVDTPETREYRTDYYTEITRADTDMGQLYDYAREHLGENTLFLFSSDHGAQWPFGKWNLYDTSTRVPLLAAWPGVTKPGSRTGAMVSWVDLLPTFIELAGGTPPAGLDGKSFVGVLRGSTATHRDEIYTTHSGDGRMNVYPIRAVRTAQFKYIRNLYPEYKHTTFIDLAKDSDGIYYWRSWAAAAKTNPAAAAIIEHYHVRPAEELYDVVADPAEGHNLAADPKFANVRKGLRAKLDAWMSAQGDQKTLFQEPHELSEPEFVETPKGAPENTSDLRH
jgi:arylsulfatase A-like enzyme